MPCRSASRSRSRPRRLAAPDADLARPAPRPPRRGRACSSAGGRRSRSPGRAGCGRRSARGRRRSRPAARRPAGSGGTASITASRHLGQLGGQRGEVGEGRPAVAAPRAGRRPAGACRAGRRTAVSTPNTSVMRISTGDGQRAGVVLDLVEVAGRDAQLPGQLDLADPAVLAQPAQPRAGERLGHGDPPPREPDHNINTPVKMRIRNLAKVPTPGFSTIGRLRISTVPIRRRVTVWPTSGRTRRLR